MNTDKYKDRKYSIVPYNSNWPIQFNFYADKIRNIFGDSINIEHIGSTAVPGMSGKECIDVLVMLEDLNDIKMKLGEIKDEGFIDAGEFVMKDSRLFRVMKANKLIANIHFFNKDHPHALEMIAVRNYLRIHTDEAIIYSSLKNDLYQKYAGDYAEYRKHKDEYMKSLIKKVEIH